MIRYLVIGSNNFWYGACSTKKAAMNIAKEVIKDDSYIDFGDPESVYVYKVEKLVAEIE